MNEMQAYLESLNSKNRSVKALARFLRSVIKDSDDRIARLMKNPTKQSVVNFGDGDGPQPTDNKELADRQRDVKKHAQGELKELQGDAATQKKSSREKSERNKRINSRKKGMIAKMSGRGGGGGSINTPDETARRGRMSLLRRNN